MRDKKLFSLSSALISENLKIYWYVPALTFVIYFFSGIFPILLQLSNLDKAAQYINYSLANWNFAYCIIMILLPLIVAVQMMGFFHKETKSLVLHAQPFSKAKLFNSHIATGWIMCIIPVILMAICYMLFMREAFIYEYQYDDNGTRSILSQINVYTVKSVFMWFISSVSIITFFYGVFVLAGSLTGNSAMHVLLSSILFGIVPLIIYLSTMYCENFIYGYETMPESVSELILRSNPILALIEKFGNPLSVGLCILYIAIGIALSGFAKYAYQCAKLEHVGDTMIFKVMEEIITYLVVFVGMAAFGFFFRSINTDSGKGMFILGLIVGTFITFIITKIIINKSVKIVNKQNIKSLVIYLVLAALFVSVTVYDLTGYAKRVPALDQIESFESSGMFISYDDEPYYYYDDLEDSPLSLDKTLDSHEALQKVIELHQYIVDNKLYTAETRGNASLIGKFIGYGNASGGDERITFMYKLKNGTTLNRTFEITVDQKVAELINVLVTDPEYKDNLDFSDKIDSEKISYILLTLYSATEAKDEYMAEKEGSEPKTVNTVTIDDSADMKKILDARNKDIQGRTYINENAQGNSDDYVLGSCEIYTEPIKAGEKSDISKMNARIWFDVDAADVNTIECIKEMGFGDLIK